MNGKNGIKNPEKLGLKAIVSFDAKGRILIPHKIRKLRKKTFYLFVTERALVLKDII